MQLTRYNKGSNAERELIKVLFEKGFSVVRAAGSGKTSLPSPDIVALNSSKKMAFECKAWDSEYLSIPIEQLEEQLSWASRAGVEFFVVWKMPREGFYFLAPTDFVRTDKAFSITKKTAYEKGVRLEVLLGEQSRLKV